MSGHRFAKPTSIVLALVLAVAAISCTAPTKTADRIGVAVTLPPQAEFVEKVGGEKVAVTVMVPPGYNPHTDGPMPAQMKDLARAKMYARVGSGVEFELVWMDRLAATNREMLVVDCSAGIQLMAMTGEHGGATDPHIWLSPPNAKIMVRNICSGLIGVDPDNRAYYEQNRDAYLQKLTQLDQDIRDGLSGVTHRAFMVYHPAFGYLAREYALTMLPVEEAGKEPTPAGMARLIEQAREYNIRVIFAAPQSSPASARVIAREIGGTVVFVDSLAKDYIGNLRAVLGELVRAME
ncbi:metal ABC transporter solute-binding protein, Zn/Mn family [Chloroflexota bacterium]